MKNVLIRFLVVIMYPTMLFLFFLYGVSAVVNILYWIITGRSNVLDRSTIIVDRYINYINQHK